MLATVPIGAPTDKLHARLETAFETYGLERVSLQASARHRAWECFGVEGTLPSLNLLPCMPAHPWLYGH